MAGKADDLEAVRSVVATLEGFEQEDQERIIRWAREKLGLSNTQGTPPTSMLPPPAAGIASSGAGRGRDLRAFVSEKAPGSDTQFAATVAYYYQFEAPESERRAAITAEDLVDACRKAVRTRPPNPGQTLRNAHRDGLLDRAEPGSFKLNAVGENLVAMTLPAGGAPGQAGPRRPKPKAKKKAAKRD